MICGAELGCLQLLPHREDKVYVRGAHWHVQAERRALGGPSSRHLVGVACLLGPRDEEMRADKRLRAPGAELWLFDVLRLKDLAEHSTRPLEEVLLRPGFPLLAEVVQAKSSY